MKIEHVHNSPGKKSKFSVWIPVLVYLAAIFILSAQHSFPGTQNIDIPDKLVHFLIYMGLCMVVYRSATQAPLIRYPGPYAQAFILSAIYGASDEYHQRFVYGRTPDVMDWLADISGAAMGLLIIAVIRKFHMIREKQHD